MRCILHYPRCTTEFNPSTAPQPPPQVPPMGKGSLYIRPLLIGTGPILGLGPAPGYTFTIFAAAVGAYFKGGQLTPIDLIVEERFHRAAPGGMGGTKAAGNYSPVSGGGLRTGIRHRVAKDGRNGGVGGVVGGIGLSRVLSRCSRVLQRSSTGTCNQRPVSILPLSPARTCVHSRPHVRCEWAGCTKLCTCTNSLAH